MSETEVNRKVHFLFAPIYDSQDSSGKNNMWVYHRAPDGYIFELHSVTMSCTSAVGNVGVFGLFDGHEYTHWNLWPGVESREYLVRMEFNQYLLDLSAQLNGWKCKEYTIGIRSRSETVAFKVLAIVWFTLKKASREELLEYAIKHPFNPDAFKRSLRGTTVEPGEE